MGTRCLIAVCAFSVAGCSWSRFDDVSTNPPVVILNKPSKMHGGFGASLAAASNATLSRVMVGGADGKNIASVFDLGTGTDPTVDARDTGSCEGDDCFLGNQPAGLAVTDFGATTGPEKLCFVFGFSSSSTPPSVFGLDGRCLDNTEYTLAVPPSVVTKVIQAEVLGQPDDPEVNLVLATDKDASPGLIAGTRDQALAWYYSPTSKGKPTELIPPGTPDSGFGAAVASIRMDDQSRVLAVAAPDEGHVWLFNEKGQTLGCLGGPVHFGQTLATGRVNKDDQADELLIADGTNVTVVSGAALSGLSPTDSTTCSLGALPPNAIMASFSCASRGTIDGCPGGFGTSMDVGDLDGDGDGEVIIGAPGISVRGTSSAGAVLVYDMEGPNPLELTDELFMSSANSGDKLGTAVVAAHLATRDVIVAGAPGSGRVGIFYCSVLLPDGAGGVRCQ